MSFADDCHNTIEALQGAIADHHIDPSTLAVFFDGGEVFVNDAEGNTIYQGYEIPTMADLFLHFLGVKQGIV